MGSIYVELALDAATFSIHETVIKHYHGMVLRTEPTPYCIIMYTEVVFEGRGLRKHTINTMIFTWFRVSGDLS